MELDEKKNMGVRLNVKPRRHEREERADDSLCGGGKGGGEIAPTQGEKERERKKKSCEKA